MAIQDVDSQQEVIRKGPYPELTVPAILVGYLLGSIITLSIGYASLILGFSIEGSELAAILGFGILRGVLKRTSIIENNINQTVASSVNGASAGMMFSVPALFILGQSDFNPYLMVFGCIAGGILGIAFIIPLRKQMIDFERLPYPGGIAVATILKSPGAGIKKSSYLLMGVFISGMVHVLAQMSHIHDIHLGEMLGAAPYLNISLYFSLLTIGVAFIAGKGGVFFVIGGFVCYLFLAPILSYQGLLPTVDPNALRVQVFRPVGIGMLIGGAISGIIIALPLVISAIKTMHTAGKLNSTSAEEELPIHVLYSSIIGASILLFGIAVFSVPTMGVARGCLMAVLGTLWIWVSGVILSECIGRTNWSPLSGMTLIAVTILIFAASGLGDRHAIMAAIMVGAATCVAMAQATDLMLDLKSGYIVGASPRKQQIAQMCGSWLGPILVMALIFILHKAYGLGSEKLPAPQGQALASMISGILGGDIPMGKYLGGAGLGAILSASGIGGLGILVGLGFYMPFNIVLSYSLGTLIRLGVDKLKGENFSQQVGIPIAAGMIVGEALVGVAFALNMVVSGL
ncbi:MAG: OPT/YSL family transporter [Oligoflexales bacterium]|nr:OPT/YSL family transporter [Oligoflexales bacterium]